MKCTIVTFDNKLMLFTLIFPPLLLDELQRKASNSSKKKNTFSIWNKVYFFRATAVQTQSKHLVFSFFFF